ncbi:MAG: hypothetical protein KDM91_20150 [Verrucomicrobiae bacterium]|nr:hypothetical protein [Verrucomicrobiae bacterium]
MNNEFEILSAFLESFEPEVSGRSAEPVSDADRDKIERFARGELGADERAAVAPMLAANENAMRVLLRALGKGA